MKQKLIIILCLLFIGCGNTPNFFDGKKCTHCWKYAGSALTYNDIGYGFKMADKDIAENPNKYPKVASITKAIIRNYIVETPIIIDDPVFEDYEICSDHMCAVYTGNHYYVYDYDSGFLFDNCNCRSGCIWPSKAKFKKLIATVSIFRVAL